MVAWVLVEFAVIVVVWVLVVFMTKLSRGFYV
jgi:hypothetical protein